MFSKKGYGCKLTPETIKAVHCFSQDKLIIYSSHLPRRAMM